MSERVLIAGGGIGGLATAIGLKRAGIPFTLIERAPELREIGAGIQLWTNAVFALEQLGLGDATDAIGQPVERMVFRTRQGAKLIEVPIAELAAAAGAKSPLVVKRPELLTMLADELKDESIELGVAVTGFEQGGDGVTVRLDDGRELSGAALIAADGARSTVRASLLPGIDCSYRGYQYLRAIAPPMHTSIEPGESTFLLGRGDRFGIECGHAWTYWFAVIVTPQGTEDSARGRKQDMIDRFRAFASPVPEAIEATPEEMIGRSDIFDLDPLERWVDGRVVLIGDAAHAITPNRGRGAAESLEDAVALSDCLAAVSSLADGAAVEGALKAFEAKRRPPAIKIQKSTRKIGELANWSDPVRCAIRELLMKRIISKAMVNEMRNECVELGRRRAA
jgi:2-polyprenyl-6-methoxyphenol hydroxylase-like FAD-dependent oxidoreductase